MEVSEELLCEFLRMEISTEGLFGGFLRLSAI